MSLQYKYPSTGKIKIYNEATRMAKLMVTSVPTDEENMTWEELATLLGVQSNERGEISSHEMLNACLRVEDNLAVQALPEADRIRAIRSAIAAIDYLIAGKSGIQA